MSFPYVILSSSLPLLALALAGAAGVQDSCPLEDFLDAFPATAITLPSSGSRPLRDFSTFPRGPAIGKGGNATAYDVPGQPKSVLVVRGFIDRSLNSDVADAAAVMRAQESVPREVHLARIKAIGVTADRRVALLQERAPGKPLHEHYWGKEVGPWLGRLRELAEAPQAHYDKFISDLRALERVGLSVDPSKPNNFFYDPERGFMIIDVFPKNGRENTKGIESPLIYQAHLWNERVPVTPEIAASIGAILQRLERAGYHPGAKDEIERKLKEKMIPPLHPLDRP
jgi:hypothetical protein